MEKNSFVEGQVCDVIKIPRTKILKITFSKTSIAKKATEIGLRMFSMSISPYQIKQDTHVNIKNCMRCYMVEDHFTSECPKPADYKICSECGELGHIWRECDSSIKKCINCKKDHRTLAMKCPIRKEITKTKRNEEQQSTTYSNAPQPTNNMQNMGSCTPDTHSTMYGCLMFTHILNANRPGTYNTELNKMLKNNKLPPLVAPDNPPSREIMNIMANITIPASANLGEVSAGNTEQREQEKGATGATGEAPATEETPTVGEPQSHETNETSTMQESVLSQGKKRWYPVKGEDVGFMVYTKQSVGWPKKDVFSKEVLLEGIKSKKYKYTYAKKDLTDDEILKIIANRTMDITIMLL